MMKMKLNNVTMAIALAYSTSALASENLDCILAKEISASANMDMKFAQSLMNDCYLSIEKNPRKSSEECKSYAISAADLIGDVFAARIDAASICRKSRFSENFLHRFKTE